MEKKRREIRPNSRFSRLWPRWAKRRAPRFLHRNVWEGVLGTTLELQIAASSRELGARVETEILNEIDRLEAIFSFYQPESEFNRWQSTFDQEIAVSPELAQVLEGSEIWRARSEGAFNPAVEAISQAWKIGAQSRNLPDSRELERLSREIAAPLWSVDTDARRARRLTRHRASLNSIAKGFIVDRACFVAQREGVEEVLVSIGGDLRHVGAEGVTIAVANPFTLADNAPPLARVRLHNASAATSGRARRGFGIGERWFSHVIDPRTGWPVERTVSASVVAPDALTADVLATVCSVVSPDEALQIADSMPEIGVFLSNENGETASNAFWRALTV